MKILITGIGCIGKSSLRERIAAEFHDKVVTVDMDYTSDIPSENDKVIIVESVHGLEENPQSYDKILYLLPPRWHAILWLRRVWAWFSTGIVDLSDPKGVRKQYAIFNIPIILKILSRNIFFSKRWTRSDLIQLQEQLKSKAQITSSYNEGYKVIKSWIFNYIN